MDEQTVDTEAHRQNLVDQAMRNQSVSAAIQTFNAVTALGILRPPRLVNTSQTRYDASTNR